MSKRHRFSYRTIDDDGMFMCDLVCGADLPLSRQLQLKRREPKWKQSLKMLPTLQLRDHVKGSQKKVSVDVVTSISAGLPWCWNYDIKWFIQHSGFVCYCVLHFYWKSYKWQAWEWWSVLVGSQWLHTFQYGSGMLPLTLRDLLSPAHAPVTLMSLCYMVPLLIAAVVIHWQ